MTLKCGNNGISINTFPVLQPVLKRWQRLNAAAEWFNDGDAPWWYNERASLSLFAGAIWLSGGWAFEEFNNYKKVTHKGASGRSDIAFGVGGKYFLAEAKQCWPTLNGNLDVAVNNVKQSLNKACEEVRQISDRRYEHVGFVFVVPAIVESKELNLERYIPAFIDRLTTLTGVTVAWTFPKKARALKPENQYSNYISPGVALVIRKA